MFYIPLAHIHINRNGHFAANAQAAHTLIQNLKDGEYVISPVKGQPGIYEVNYKIGTTTDSMTLGPAGDLTDWASVYIKREINPKRWGNNPEIQLVEMHLDPVELIDFLKRQPVSEVLNLIYLEKRIPAGRKLDNYFEDILKCSGPKLKTLYINALAALYVRDFLPSKLKNAGCDQLSTLKINGESWRAFYFGHLARIKALYPLMKIELPCNAYFVGDKEEAEKLLSEKNNDSFAIWNNKKNPNIFELLFKINGTFISEPLQINLDQYLPEKESRDIMAYIINIIKNYKKNWLRQSNKKPE